MLYALLGSDSEIHNNIIHTRTQTFAVGTFWENPANVGALFQWEMGGIVSGDFPTRKKSVNVGVKSVSVAEKSVSVLSLLQWRQGG